MPTERSGRNPDTIRGRIFDIQRFSIHDGPGIRTTVFLKGCPLRCLWCHNPEGIDPKTQLSFLPDKCIGCGVCFKLCEHGAHVMAPDGHRLDRACCVVCGACVTRCYAGALELVGREVTVGEVLQEVLADRPFYETSGGGMTLSGGEPLMQIDFTDALLSAAKTHGLHCCIETSGYANWASFRRVMPKVDLFLYDVKDTNSRRHKANTGVSNEKILANLRRLHDAGAKVRIRVPLIPLYNDHQDNLRGLAALADSLPRIEGLEIISYNQLGSGKLGRLGLPEVMDRKPQPPDDKVLSMWVSLLRKHNVNATSFYEWPRSSPTSILTTSTPR